MALEVLGILIVIVALAAERLVEMVGSPLLEKYGIQGKGVRTGIMILGATVVNFALMWGLDLDPISTLLNENQSLVNIGIAAFTASGFSNWSHTLQGFLGKRKTVTEVIQTSVNASTALDAIGPEVRRQLQQEIMS